MLGAKRICRVRIAKDELEKMSKEDLLKSWLLQEQFVDYLESKVKENTDQVELMSLRELVEKHKQQNFESTRKENMLVLRLTTKEQELQELLGQIQELKAQAPSASQLRSAPLDPAVNLMFEKMRKEIEVYRARLHETQEELSAWKFTPDSNTGKRLMSKCRLLHQENEELGKNLSSGRFAKLESDLALQKSFNEELKKSQLELDEFIMELDEDVEGMQGTIYYLQQQLRESKEKIQAMEKERDISSFNVPINNHIESSPILSNELPNAIYSPMIASPPSNALTQLTAVFNKDDETSSDVEKDINSGQSLSSNYVTKKTGSIAITVDTDDHFLTKLPSPQSKSNMHELTLPDTITNHTASNHCLDGLDMDMNKQTNTEALMDSPTFEASEFSSDEPPVGQKKTKKAKEPAKRKRATENGTRGRKRTRVSRPVVTREQTTVKRLRRRNIIVGPEACDIDLNQQTLEIDTDTEVQVAHTLAQWAATNKERKDHMTRDVIVDKLGNLEIKGSKSSEKAA